MAIPTLPPQPTGTKSQWATMATAFLAALDPWATALGDTAEQVSADANSSAQNAASAAALANNALNSAIDAANSAANSVISSQTIAGSFTTLTIGTGSKSFTADTGKLFVRSMFVLVSDYNTPANYMVGQVTSYDAGTGAMVVNVTRIGGTGGASASLWLVTLTASGTFLSDSVPVTLAQGGTSTATPPSVDQILTATSSTTATWQNPKAQAGGATSTTSAVDINLVSTNNRVQSINMTAVGKVTKLPDATTIAVKGGAIFIINAVGYGFSLLDFGGNHLTRVESGKTAAVYLVDNGTTSGLWIVRTFSDNLPRVGAVLAVNATASNYATVASLSATGAILCYAGASGFLNVVYLGISGNVLTPGTIAVVNAVTSSFIAVDKLTTTKAICAFIGASGFLNTVCLDVNTGTGITTPGTVLVANAVASGAVSLSAFSSTIAYCCYAGASSNAYAVIFSISGSTITNGTPAAMTGPQTAGFTSVVMVTATKAVCAWKSLTGLPFIAVLNNSGTTITPVTTVAISGDTIAYGAVCVAALTATSLLVVINGQNMIYAVAFTLATNTLTPGDIVDINDFGANAISLAPLSSSQAVCNYTVANKAVYALLLKVNGVEISVSSNSSIAPISNNAYCDVYFIANLKAVMAYTGMGNYINAAVIEQSASL